MTQKENSIGWYIEEIRQKQASEDISNITARERNKNIDVEISEFIEGLK